MRKSAVVLGALLLVTGLTLVHALPPSSRVSGRIVHVQKVKKGGVFKSVSDFTGEDMSIDSSRSTMRFGDLTFRNLSARDDFEFSPDTTVAFSTDNVGFSEAKAKTKFALTSAQFRSDLADFLEQIGPFDPDATAVEKTIGLDDFGPFSVDAASLRLGGKVKAIRDFTATTGKIQIRYTGTVEGGTHEGKAIKGKLKITFTGEF